MFKSKVKFNYRRGLQNNLSTEQIDTFVVGMFGKPTIVKRIEHQKVKPTPTEHNIYNNKMVGIFSPSTLETDKLMINSIKYYWNKNPEFEPFLILEYDGTKEGLIKTLNKSYELGKRYIFGFPTSSSVLDSLEWLNEHPDVQGVTETATSGSLEIPKKIYRTYPDALIELELGTPYIFNGLTGNGAIYYIYNSNQAISSFYKSKLTEYCQLYGVPFKEYKYERLEDINYNNVKNTIQSIYDDMNNYSYNKSSICLSLVDYTVDFYKLFNSGMANVGSLGASFFDFKNNGYINIPTSTEEAKTYFNNISYIFKSEALNPSRLLYDAQNKPGLSGLNILYQLHKHNGYMNEIGTYGSSYVLNPITRDNVAYPTFVFSQFKKSNNKFNPLRILYQDNTGTKFECVISQ